jgi:hypothetical protein
MKAPYPLLCVIPAEAGIQENRLDPGFRRGDRCRELAGGLSCSVVTNKVMVVRRNDGMRLLPIGQNFRQLLYSR